jgi:hypothetical protein
VSTTGMWEELFRDRHWRVAEEVTGQRSVPGEPPVVVTFDRGRFSVAAPGAYRSPLSTNLGRRGVVLVETDDAGALDIPGSRIAVGEPALNRAREKFGTIW